MALNMQSSAEDIEAGAGLSVGLLAYPSPTATRPFMSALPPHLASHGGLWAMDRQYAIVAALMCAFLLLKALGAGNGMFGPPRPVAKRFLTQREAAMLVAIEHALPHCRIHAQVAMGALLTVPSSAFGKRKFSDRNSFSQKIVDFVAQDRRSGEILALIEVDDWSHNAMRDGARDRMTNHAGYRTIRIPGSTRPTFAEVRDRVVTIISFPGRFPEQTTGAGLIGERLDP